MIRWFRHYPGLARDEKLISVALRCGQAIERVVWVYTVILEDCSMRNDDGAFAVDPDEMAHLVRCAPGEIALILTELELAGRTEAGRVCAWNERQRPSDRSARRTAAWRERQREKVTGAKRHGDALESESESEKTSKSTAVTPADVVEAWNKLARRIDKPEVGDLDEPEVRDLEALVETYTARELAAAINAVERSPFLRGDTGWGGCDFAWMIKPANFAKIRGGQYGH